MTDMSAIKLHRMRQFVDSEAERLTEILSTDIPGDSASMIRGMIHSLDRIKVLYLLTPEESAESVRTRLEMFGGWWDGDD